MIRKVHLCLLSSLTKVEPLTLPNFSTAVCLSNIKAIMKEQMRELEELRLSRDEAVNGAKDTEKKLKSMEADSLRMQEV